MNPLKKTRSKLLSIKASPRKISSGFALGVFLGTTPFIGTKVFIALGLTSFFKLNRLASVIGVYHINILTAPLFYTLSFGVGKWISGAKSNLVIPDRLNADWLFMTLFGNWEIFKTLLIGGFILGIPMSLLAYFLSYVYLIKSQSCVCDLNHPNHRNSAESSY